MRTYEGFNKVYTIELSLVNVQFVCNAGAVAFVLVVPLQMLNAVAPLYEFKYELKVETLYLIL